MKSKIFIIIFASLNLTFLFDAMAKEPIQNRMTWYNKSLNSPDGGSWHLHISELPKGSKCSFGTRMTPFIIF